MCKVMGVSTSGYYNWKKAEPSKQELRKREIQERILFHYHDSEKRYGAPKITKKLHHEGYTSTERTVGTYMNELGIRSIVSRKFKVVTTDSKHDLPIAPNIVNQNFDTPLPNKVWAADITYIPCRQGRLYLASILDLCTKEVVGWKLGDRMTSELILGALNDAYDAKKPKEGLIHHSDRGSQYASIEYRKQLKKYKITASMSRKGNCYDNACIESFHSILKKELIYCIQFKTKQQAYEELYRYLEFFYNRKRIHSALGYLSPVRYAQLFENKAL